MKRKIMTVIGALALALAAVTMNAQERNQTIVLTNTAIGTGYYPLGGTNYIYGPGLSRYQGGTNFLTVSNATIYAGSTGQKFNVSQMGSVPVWWLLSAQAVGSGLTNLVGGTIGTSNLLTGLDLSPDPNGVYWSSNSVTATVTLNGSNLVYSTTYFPVNNGTNVFSGYYWGRFSQVSTTETNWVSISNNQLTFFR